LSAKMPSTELTQAAGRGRVKFSDRALNQLLTGNFQALARAPDIGMVDGK
jgi:hypothetical protein